MALIERDATIVNPLGMHARPAAEFVKTASRFKSHVQVSKDGINGKSILGVMMLVAEKGASMHITADGEDAELAMDALISLVAAGFNEMHLTGYETDQSDGEDEEGVSA
jgi:phosphocarrier protein HPr